MRKLEEATKSAISTVIAAHREKIEKITGFVGCEPGFRIVDGWVRREPAIIVYVERKRPVDELVREEVAQRSVGGYRIDIVQADPMRLLAANDETVGLSETLAAAAELTYAKRDGNPIDTRFTLTRPILCHVGPDAGWPVLKRFLEGTRDTLTAAMYDLNADYVAKVLIETVRDNDLKFVLTWDAGMTGDEPAIRTLLKDKLKTRMSAWLVKTGGGFRFDSAYHEKVAVQDSRAFWLSSGNWSKRSQPNIDPIAEPATAQGMYAKGNREWHIVVEDAPLAKLFEDYILYDREQSEEEDTALAEIMPPAMPDLFVPIESLGFDEGLALAAVEPVAPKRLPAHGRPFTVQPVLCPDNYINRIDALIRTAESSLYLQYSYITYSDADRDKSFRDMLDYIGDLSHKRDFDLRIIVGNNNAEEKVRKLIEAGFNEKAIRVQANIHNKGIIIDGHTVLVSSANWSSAGCLRNRDAGLVIEDAEVARYYSDVFVNDWEQRARSDFGSARPTRIALAGEPTPVGMVRMRWDDYHDG